MSVPTTHEASQASDNTTPVLSAVGVVKRFGDNVVLRGLDLDVAAHEVVVLLGASGSGKSTLLRCANLLERVDDGQIFLAGEDITAKLTEAPGNHAKIGGLKVTTKDNWFAARPSGTENIYKVYAESFVSPEALDKVLDEATVVVDKALSE